MAIYFDVLPTTGWRNDGAPLWITWNLRKILNGETLDDLKKAGGFSDGTNVIHLSPINPKSQHGKFDLNILIDYGEDSLGIPLDWELPHPSVYWAFDTHIDEKGYQYRLNRAKQFDHVFLCHKGQIESFIKGGIDPKKIHYMPVAAEPDCYRPYPIMEKYDWCFIGHLNSGHRIDLVDRFVKEFDLGDGKGYLGWRMPQIQGHNVLDDVAKKFSMSKIIINDAIKMDLNMRLWESMACGKMLLTQRIPGIEDFFKDGKDLVLYDSIDDAVEKARYYLLHDEERVAIGKSGLERILAGHTYADRTKAILDICLPGWRESGDVLYRDIPEYDPNGSLVPSSGVYCRPSGHLHDEQSQTLKEVVPSV